jgi:phytanoyl-CoA hydroxylase
MPSTRTEDAALAAMEAQGFYVQENLVPDSVTAHLLEVAKSMPSGQDGTFAPIPMPHRVHPDFLAMMRFPPIVEIVERLVGGEASGIGGEFFFSRPGVPGFVKHQDNAYVQAPPDAFVSVWTALCDVDEENGCLSFYPGSHKLGALETEVLDHAPVVGQNPGAQGLQCVFPETYTKSAITMPLRRGSTVFFHGYCVHESQANRSTNRFRYSFLSTYLRKGSPFRPGRLQQRTEVPLR